MPRYFSRSGQWLAEAGVDQHDLVFERRAVEQLPGLEVFDGHLVVGIGGTLFGNVDADRRTDEPLERQLVDGLSLLSKMPRRIDVRAAMFGADEAIGGVVVTLVRDARRLGNQLEAFFGRPVNRLGVEGVGEVDEAFSVLVLSQRSGPPTNQSENRENEESHVSPSQQHQNSEMNRYRLFAARSIIMPGTAAWEHPELPRYL